MPKKIIYLQLLLFTYVTTGNAQKNVEHQNLLWMRYSLKVKLNDHWQIRQELEERSYWFPWRQHQVVSRTVGERKLGKGWSAGAGFTYFLHSLPNDPYVADYDNQTELRPQLELSYKQELSDKFSLSHRYWTEFRIFEQPDGAFKYENNRSRYKVEVKYQAMPQIALIGFEEILLNNGGNVLQNVFDQNRYGASIQYMPTPNFGLELGYLNWFQERKSGIDFYNRQIVRFTIHHSITVKHPKP